MPEEDDVAENAKVPDLLTDGGKARTVAQQLQGLQQEAFGLELRRIVANHKRDQPASGGGPGLPGAPGGGEGQTYEQRAAELAEAQNRIARAHADLMPKVSELVEAGTL